MRNLRCTLALALAFVFVLACGGDDPTGPSTPGLVAGTYTASFTIPLDNQTPGNLIGDHEFTWRVGDPEDASSFQLLASRHRGRTFGGERTEWDSGHLSPDTDEVIAVGSQWRVRWSLEGSSTSIHVTLEEERGAGFSVFSCGGSRSFNEDYPGVGCDVERVE